jgi:hypothetical protein
MGFTSNLKYKKDGIFIHKMPFDLLFTGLLGEKVIKILRNTQKMLNY